MALHVLISHEEKLALIEQFISEFRGARKRGSSPRETKDYETLKALAEDIRSRLASPRSNALDDLERKLATIQKSKTALGYNQGQLLNLAYTVVGKWPIIKAALENFKGDSE